MPPLSKESRSSLLGFRKYCLVVEGSGSGDLHPAKPCLWRDCSAEKGGVGRAKEKLEEDVVGREVTRTWIPARKISQELQQFRLYFTGPSEILKK